MSQQIGEKAIDLNQQTRCKSQQSHEGDRSQRKKFNHEAFSKNG
jgi:hypothetical protein